MCDDNRLFIVSPGNGLRNTKTKILGNIKKTDFIELQYVLNKSFDRNGMDAKEVAMDLVVAGYGKIITLEKQCNELTDDNKALQSNLDMYILKYLSLKHELEELKNANSERSKSNDN